MGVGSIRSLWLTVVSIGLASTLFGITSAGQGKDEEMTEVKNENAKAAKRQERMKKRRNVIMAAFILLALAWAFRYQVAEISGAGFYRMNRWTGAVEFCTPDGCRWAK